MEEYNPDEDEDVSAIPKTEADVASIKLGLSKNEIFER
jgi:hypothetical protein